MQLKSLNTFTLYKPERKKKTGMQISNDMIKVKHLFLPP